MKQNRQIDVLRKCKDNMIMNTKFLINKTSRELVTVTQNKNVIFVNKCVSFLFEPTNAPIYRVSQEGWTKLRESVPYVELYRYNPKHLYPKLNGYGDNGQRILKL